MGKNIEATEFPTLSGHDDAAKAKYITDIYSYANAKATEAIGWYLSKKSGKQLAAAWLRFLAIAFTTLGGLIPLMVASRILDSAPAGQAGGATAIDFAQFGYISLALAGACVFLDRFFGYSTGWIRYVTSALKLQKLREEFNVDWAVLCSSHQSSPPSVTEREAMLRRVQSFLLAIMSEVESETAAWAVEYRNSIAELDKSARQQLEASKPGVINLTVKNANAFAGGVTVVLDGVPRQTITASDCQLAPVFPGDHLVEVRAKINGKDVSCGAAMRIEPGQAVPLSLSLPTSQPSSSSILLGKGHSVTSIPNG